MTKYSVNIHCVAISTELSKEKAFIFSLSEKDIVFPVIEINNSNLSDIDQTVIREMQKYLMTNPLELVPQIITLNCETLKENKKKHTLDIVYGFLVKEGIKNFNSYWIEIDFYNMSALKYPNLIFEVIQKLK